MALRQRGSGGPQGRRERTFRSPKCYPFKENIYGKQRTCHSSGACAGRKEGRHVHILAVEDLTTVTDISSLPRGMSTTHVGALADEAEFQLDREGVKVLRTEGHDGKRWVLLDYGSVIVHVFTQEAHDYYDLEHLWADATVVPASEWMPEQPENEQ